MAKNREQEYVVPGGIDDTSLAPGTSYEMDVLIELTGFSAIWERTSDE